MATLAEAPRSADTVSSGVPRHWGEMRLTELRVTSETTLPALFA